MPPDANDKILLDRIENNFTYHPPTPEQAPKYQRLRATAKELARLVVELVPEGRERSLALTHLEEMVMFANAGIARASQAV
jgi:hypothetical protein